ncbi:hypothetical protein FHW84_001307 [Dyella sp. SG562]|uniref:hypothetical protein n=1 Tax=Dyella TaxID=231454 RepID=UPI00142114A9|nr:MULTISPECIES: hypothetical protein [unclassified Dyella]NII72741.1 hypothetical protein [Dyella sp. SG562]NKJ21727.1 hypothetical protein [Dyella sp. SG609]
MKLLRDFFRLPAAGRSLLGRRAVRRTWTVTVPAPQAVAVREPVTVAMHSKPESARARPATRRTAPKALGHLQLVSQR